MTAAHPVAQLTAEAYLKSRENPNFKVLYLKIWRTFRPSNSNSLCQTPLDKVSKIAKYCNDKKGLAVVPQGGNTDSGREPLVPVFDEIVLLLRNMNKVREILIQLADFSSVTGVVMRDAHLILYTTMTISSHWICLLETTVSWAV
ncbi:CFC_collapsed_G0047690.mRNA.1.CDS.1 [Saccharomyces cerevisiae]|nr:CFC_collapsed_G0047690.mRNA.1.CDS.1 [Saccharomyces cerevisiae]